MAYQQRSNVDDTQPSAGNASQQNKPLDANRRGYGGSVGEIRPQDATSSAEGATSTPNTSGPQGGMERNAGGNHHDVNERTQPSQGSFTSRGYAGGNLDASTETSSAQRGQGDSGGAQRNESVESPNDTGVER